jgi:rhamnosyl/mannosyltransferase
MLDDVPDVVPYFHASDVFALPSVARSEAFGLVQLEAMACAKPVVNTALASGVPYVSLDGETGITVPVGDARALALALNRLLGDRELSRRLGTNGRRRAERMFSVEAMVRETAALYEQLTAVEDPA